MRQGSFSPWSVAEAKASIHSTAHRESLVDRGCVRKQDTGDM